jgi:hypothetical protein
MDGYNRASTAISGVARTEKVVVGVNLAITIILIIILIAVLVENGSSNSKVQVAAGIALGFTLVSLLYNGWKMMSLYKNKTE